MNKKKRKSTFWFWIILIVGFIILLSVISITSRGTTQNLTIEQLNNLFTQGKSFNNVVLQRNNIQGIEVITGWYNNGSGWTKFTVNTNSFAINSYSEAFKNFVWHSNTTRYTESSWFSLLSSLLPMLILILFYIGLFYFMAKGGGAGAGANGLFGMGKNRARREKSNVKFSDVAGIEEEKSELVELVDYLKQPAKYASAGARAPKGVLMEGPPGTGKTLLAKAVAGEANVSFFSIAGSEFEEMFVGVGASRVREMFNEAKKAAPAIIFIDEIDAVGRKRNSAIGTGTNEQTLNQLLVELDGFETNSGIIVMAATNRVDVLDPALLRPGRFDRVIQVSLPDIKEREQILKLHARNKKIDPSIDWHRIAERTPGFSGAQLENVLNEAAILMVREGKTVIGINEIDEAIDRVVGGPAKKSRAMTMHDKEIVSYHESGHALIGLKLESASKVQKVTIIPRGNAGGYTIMTPKDETLFSSKSDLYAMIAGYLGGRAAEEIKFGKDKVTTGAHDDFDKATAIARRMVMQFGMSDLGITKFLTMADEAYGKTEGSYSEKTAAKIDAEVEKILEESYKLAIKVISENMETLELLAESLRVLETITAEQIDYINKNNKLPEAVIYEKEKYKEEQEKINSGKIIDLDINDIKEENKDK
ncbi:ATP-dependent zinc metalloprotease FtsH [Mycoplasma feriruminatoris]|uniref:ATP-dependent zinc metalloprotease FtsH n=1 Tax=Mycoplasma feriruminatoris TaxID=1179777 RepID=A0AAQ3DKX5_9MOLU|nr:ATP-dependent zinc metalloprotease FtsH [Mycoplasma feriruminatoris]UKS53718.1 ATP-dependent zinc metalloprotease FtsH [Mycoplasma feriruminatoris]WFQ89815.1 ATP-dependent zinc metalloprotease FtsH [Mycoplasma feriruminatoris]WFQ90635.1 ATP-dependent zinc metalloprotease FtsH [Mycoplasma feriruminatoris]WFQ91453.1 ATP-dependent zinc metalloprotease FtsH [Mycoplasma feriruminatoris]WFQ92279.1 ATP-dependent zinc metalloprotease FtsH [Mycoplasma feriruminatoris]